MRSKFKFRSRRPKSPLPPLPQPPPPLPTSHLFHIPELLTQIFLDLPAIDLLRNIPLVCRQWSEIVSTTPSIQQYIANGGMHPGDPQNTDVFRRGPRLTPLAQDIFLEFWKQVSEVWMPLIHRKKPEREEPKPFAKYLTWSRQREWIRRIRRIRAIYDRFRVIGRATAFYQVDEDMYDEDGFFEPRKIKLGHWHRGLMPYSLAVGKLQWGDGASKRKRARLYSPLNEIKELKYRTPVKGCECGECLMVIAEVRAFPLLRMLLELCYVVCDARLPGLVDGEWEYSASFRASRRPGEFRSFVPKPEAYVFVGFDTRRLPWSLDIRFSGLGPGEERTIKELDNVDPY